MSQYAVHLLELARTSTESHVAAINASCLKTQHSLTWCMTQCILIVNHFDGISVLGSIMCLLMRYHSSQPVVFEYTPYHGQDGKEA